jgi:hypothetical protein
MQAQHLYVQPLGGGAQIAFALADKPKIMFATGAMTVQQTTFQLTNVQNLSFTFNQSTNIRTDNYSSLQVFPNPVNYELRIVIPSETRNLGDIVELFDINGRRVYSARANDSEITIDMSPFQSGSYILRIGNRTTKVVKQ